MMRSLLIFVGSLVISACVGAQELPMIPPAGYDQYRSNIPHGTRTDFTFYSAVAGKDVEIIVYTPAGYNPSRKYSVVYGYQGIDIWPGTIFDDWCVAAGILMDNLVADGIIEPLIIVALDDQYDGTWSNVNDMTIYDAIPYIDSHYSTYADADHRGLYGYSWGGGYAFNVGCANLDVFHHLSPSSSAPNKAGDDSLFPNGGAEAKEKIKTLLISCGDADWMGLYPNSLNCHNYCVANEIPHHWFTVPGGNHDADSVWRPAMWNFLQLLDATISGSAHPTGSLSAYIQVEGECYNSDSEGLATENIVEGVQVIGSIETGDYAYYPAVDFGSVEAQSFMARVSSNQSSGSIELRLDRLDGEVIGTCFIPDISGSQTWMLAHCDVYGIPGVHDLYLRFKGNDQSDLFNVDWWQFSIDSDDNLGQITVPDPIHLYSFRGRGGTTVYDDIGGVDGQTFNGAQVIGGTMTLSKNSSQYVEFPEGLLSSLTDCTITCWINLNDLDPWCRIFDFGSGPGRSMYLTPCRGDYGLRFAIKTRGVFEQIIDSTQGSFPTDAWVQVAVTLAGNAGRLYVNGQLVGTNDTMTINPSDLGQTTQNWLGRSQDSDDPYLDGTFEEFSIYDIPLSASEIFWLFSGGDSQSITPATRTEVVSLDSSSSGQTIEGLGGAICFYNGWFTAHPYKQEIFDYAFRGLNLSMLRLGNWWRGDNGQDTASYEIVNAANESLGHPIPILMTSWSPPAYLKSNGEVGHGGTLIKKGGLYDYAGFSDYWADSLQDYIAHGVSPTWIGIQNEPDWTADYDSCRFDPTEGQYASFALAQDAVYNQLQANMASPPKLLGPECVGLYGNAGGLRNYMAQMNPDTFYGVAHHLYGGSSDGTPDGYNSVFNTVLNRSESLFPGKPRFMTEFGDTKGLIPCANLIHNSLVVEQVSGYNHWSLIWPGDIGLIEIEFPWGSGDWISEKGYWLNPSYWSMKHYSYFVESGYVRVTTGSSDSDLLTSAYLSPDQKQLVTVIINRSENSPAVVSLDTDSFVYDYSHIYQSTEQNPFEYLGSVHSTELTAPVSSVTTVLLDQEVEIGPASAPTPINEASEIGSNVTLTWTPDSNATDHLVYLGTDANAVATATPLSEEYQGTVSSASFNPDPLSGGVTYYWRVDEKAYSTVTVGDLWSFSTVAPEMHAHLPFDGRSGTTAPDTTGNGWNGTLVNGPTWRSGTIDYCVDLDGSNDYVSLPNGVVDGLTHATFSVWVKLNSIDTWSRVLDFGTGTTVNMFLTPRCGGSNVVRFAITTGGAGSEQQINGASALASGTWTHVAVTLGNGMGILYVDGEEVGRNTNMTLTPDSLGRTTQNYLGKSQYPDPYLNGRVDDFRIYGDALGASAIAELATP